MGTAWRSVKEAADFLFSSPRFRQRLSLLNLLALGFLVSENFRLSLGPLLLCLGFNAFCFGYGLDVGCL